MNRTVRDDCCPHCHQCRDGGPTFLILNTRLPRGYDPKMERVECQFCGGRWWQMPTGQEMPLGRAQ